MSFIWFFTQFMLAGVFIVAFELNLLLHMSKFYLVPKKQLGLHTIVKALLLVSKFYQSQLI